MLSSPQSNPLLKTPAVSVSRTVKNQLLLYRCMIAYRFLLAAVGGYVLAALRAMLIAHHFQAYGSSAAVSATLIAFCLHTAVFIGVFLIQKTLKASLWVLLPILVVYLLSLYLGV